MEEFECVMSKLVEPLVVQCRDYCKLEVQLEKRFVEQGVEMDLKLRISDRLFAEGLTHAWSLWVAMSDKFDMRFEAVMVDMSGVVGVGMFGVKVHTYVGF